MKMIKRMNIASHKVLKMALIASVLSLSFVSFAPSAEAEGTINDFSQAVHDELNSNSTFMQEARQYIQEARQYVAQPDEEGPRTYDSFEESVSSDSRYAELMNNGGLSYDAAHYMTIALEEGDGDQDVLTKAAMNKVAAAHSDDPIYQGNGLLSNMDNVLSDNDTQYAIAGGRIIPGSSHVFGDQTVYGSLSVENGIDANGQKITNVGDGEISETSKDAVNGSQLYAVTSTIDQINNQVNLFGDEVSALNRRVGRLDRKINKVGAGAAALAALQPLPYSSHQKWSISTGYGHYHNANASAFGAYYYPNEDVMVSLGSVVGNGENMVNAGVSVRLGPSGEKVKAAKTSSVSADVKALKSMVEQQGQQIDALEKQNDLLAKELESLK